ncbi:hypothetical protein M8818_002966 [Zalaria obscura]|uniref:Uncharacterized protein n=1 Tax=Zalaria obscura TaxID=2024903 RepID=A0ACC3SG63_9PEZI
MWGWFRTRNAWPVQGKDDGRILEQSGVLSTESISNYILQGQGRPPPSRSEQAEPSDKCGVPVPAAAVHWNYRNQPKASCCCPPCDPFVPLSPSKQALRFPLFIRRFTLLTTPTLIGRLLAAYRLVTLWTNHPPTSVRAARHTPRSTLLTYQIGYSPSPHITNPKRIARYSIYSSDI